jgi:glycogen debranching enzyme
LIQKSFEKCYYVPSGEFCDNLYNAHRLTSVMTSDRLSDSEYRINSSLVNRRGIYKDVYGSGPSHEWADYQFRCNFPIAMTVAPEMFDDRHALGALQLADQVLRAPLGMKTLDPNDLQYRPNYDNSNDSDDPSVAKGLNYHNVSR